MFYSHKPLCFLLIFIFFSCADDQPYLHNSIKRASDAIMIPCDPYELNVTHTCVVFASTYLQKLVIYDATAEEWVLAPNQFFPLNVSVGPATHKLAKVTSASSQFPYFLALDQALPALFAVQAFPTASKTKNKNILGFFTPQEQKFDKALRPYHIAAWQGDTHVFVLLSYRDDHDDHSVGIVALDPVTGIRDPQIQPLIIPKFGQKPGQIVIDADRNFALISDEGAPVLHKLDLTNIKDILLNPGNARITQIKTVLAGDKIYLQKRNFGEGIKNYVALLNIAGKELRIINIDDNQISSPKILDEMPQAAYFPDHKSAPCCGDNRQWLALADIKGRLFYYLIKNNNNILSLEKGLPKPVDLLLEKHFALGQLQLSTIIGGQVLVDPSLKRPLTCPNNRKMFYIASFGTDRPRSWTNAAAQEVEAQGYSCEGEEGAYRFGYKRE